MLIVEEKQPTNVLLVSLEAQGHINPMLRLGKLLASKGLDVTLATTDTARAFNLSINDSLIHIEFFSDGLPLDYNRKADIDFHLHTLNNAGPINLRTLIKSHPKKFSCIINNPFVPWVADVAEALGIPCAMLWIQPCMLYAIYYRFFNDINFLANITNPVFSVEWPGLPVLHLEELPSFILPSNTFPSITNLLQKVFLNMNKLKWVLGNSFQELEKDVIESMNEDHPIVPVGPLVPWVLFGKGEDLDDGGVDHFKSEDTCIEWLNKQQPSSVIYISFGSILSSSENETEAIALGLQKTQRPFLWVIKPDNYPEKAQKQPLGLFDDIKEQGLIVKWSPQTKVLAHSSVGCFMSHCGWNSLVETLTAGVPVIAHPKWTDQPTNAKLITDMLHVGIKLEGDKDGGLRGEEVARCIEKIMGGKRSNEYKRNAAVLKQAAREAMVSGGSSDRNIQWFVEEIVSAGSIHDMK